MSSQDTLKRHHFHKPNRGLQAYAFFFMCLLYAPIMFIPLFSFSSGLYIRFPIEGWTLQWYGNLMERTAVLNALKNSVRVGLSVAVVSTFLGIFAAKALVRYRIPGKGPIIGFILLPLVVPPIIFGVALLLMVNALGIPLSLYTIAAGHIIICLPFAIATLLPRFEGYDAAMEEAAADLGENSWWVFWRVTVPIILPGIVASLLLTFTVSFDEFVMAFFLGGTDLTLPLYVWGQLRIPNAFPVVLALGTLILLFSFLLVFIGLRIGRRGAIKLVDRD
jgi:spermidine/putrescine transport system permease protein